MKIYRHTTFAKLNLSLAILGTQGKMHTIDSIVAPYTKYSDAVLFLPTNNIGKVDVRLLSSFKGLRKKEFATAIKPQLEKLATHFGVGGVVLIKKHIPLGAGLGGSSAVIASTVHAMLKYLAKKNGTQVEVDNAFLVQFGSDVPCMMANGYRRIQGIGDIVSVLDCDCDLNFCTHIVEGGSNSADCYKTYDLMLAKGDLLATTHIPTSVQEAISSPVNDLLAPAIALNKNIQSKMQSLEKECGKPVRLSGSGSTIFYIK